MTRVLVRERISRCTNEYIQEKNLSHATCVTSDLSRQASLRCTKKRIQEINLDVTSVTRVLIEIGICLGIKKNAFKGEIIYYIRKSSMRGNQYSIWLLAVINGCIRWVGRGGGGK